MKRILILLIAFSIILSIHAEVKILSTEAWVPTIEGFWSPNKTGLSYSNTVYGDTYYNPNWQDMRKSGSIEHVCVTRWLNLKPDRKRDWEFSIQISNLNAEYGYQYWSKSNPKLKQDADQIYWGVLIGYKENGISRISKIWIKRSGLYISYSIDGNAWKQTYQDYPSCVPNLAPYFVIRTKTSGQTYITLRGNTIVDYPTYIEEIQYITVMVGTQAKVQIGKPSAVGMEIKSEEIYDASEYMETENYAMVVRKLYNAENTYYEQPAVNLAWAYASTNEIDKALEICEALIKFEGISLNYAHSLRGLIREYKGLKEEALEDYMIANDMTNYNRLQEEIKSEQLQKKQRQQQKQQQKTSSKPTLTK